MRDNEVLKGHKKVLVELLDVTDAICKKHKIKYMLFSGSALGAVRHKSIIPWDDDIDIVMPREDYKRFLEIAPKEIDDRYFLQAEFGEHWPMFFSKLRKNNTACIERYIPKDSKIHQGIYIDIFPCDNLSDNAFMRRIQFICSKVVISKSLWQEGYLTTNVLKKIAMFVSRIFPKKKLASVTRFERGTDTEMVHTFFGGSSKYNKSTYPRCWFEETVDLEFEGGMYPVSKYYHELLTRLYDDYMTPLPEDMRGCKIHAELVDLENSYEKYIGIQKTMDFPESTRSIR